MNTGGQERSDPSDSASGQHLATISHEGRFWDVYLDFEDDPRRPDTYRGFFRFSAADSARDEEPLETTTLIIEKTYEAAVRTARSFDERQLAGLLRSVGA